MKLWIRVDASAPRDPKFGEIAAELKIRVAEVFGLCAAIWCAMGEHAVDGDLSRVDDRTLELWAMWDGRRGRFAEIFRRHFVDAEGRVSGYAERQGKLAERMEKDRKRKRTTERNATEIPRQTPRSLRGNSAATERNGTEQGASTSSLRSEVPKPPSWPARISAELANRGITAKPGKVGALLKAAVDRFGEPRVTEALENFFENGVALHDQKPEWVTLETFARNPGHWVELITPLNELTKGLSPAERDAAMRAAAGIKA